MRLGSRAAPVRREAVQAANKYLAINSLNVKIISFIAFFTTLETSDHASQDGIGSMAYDPSRVLYTLRGLFRDFFGGTCF